MCCRADHFAPSGFDHFGGIALYIFPICVVNGDEVPSLTASINASFHCAKRL